MFFPTGWEFISRWLIDEERIRAAFAGLGRFFTIVYGAAT